MLQRTIFGANFLPDRVVLLAIAQVKD